MHSRKNHQTFFVEIVQDHENTFLHIPTICIVLIEESQNMKILLQLVVLSLAFLQLLWKGSSDHIILKDSSKGLQVLKI